MGPNLPVGSSGSYAQSLELNKFLPRWNIPKQMARPSLPTGSCRGLKRRVEKTKGVWSTTKETHFSLVYGSDAMILVEVSEPLGFKVLLPKSPTREGEST